MDENLQKLYSPSQWSKRLAPDKIVDAHLEYMKKRSDLAYENVLHYKFRFSEQGEEEAIHFFYKNSDSFQVDDSSKKINFNGRKVFVYIHGGYWQWGTIFASSFMAHNFTNKDNIVAAIGYQLCPRISMTSLVNEVERAIAKILEYAENSDVYICGHSAGGHLTSMILNADFEKKYKVKTSSIKGLISVSGVFKLEPLIKTDINDNLKMDLNLANELSPMLFKNNFSIETSQIEILLAYGEHESEAFKRQSIDYFNLLKEKKFKSLNCIEIKDCDHFNVIENISEDNFSLTKEIYNMMGV